MSCYVEVSILMECLSVMIGGASMVSIMIHQSKDKVIVVAVTL